MQVYNMAAMATQREREGWMLCSLPTGPEQLSLAVNHNKAHHPLRPRQPLWRFNAKQHIKTLSIKYGNLKIDSS